MGRMKTMLIAFRNGVAFSFAWLVICVLIIAAFSGKEFVSAPFLLKLLGLCVWGSLCFAVCFFNDWMQKKGFLFSLTVFFVLFIPVETLLFYSIAENKKSPLWFGFGAIILCLYLLCIAIDQLIFRKRAEEYSKRLMEYNAREQ